jgi:hypothetical protein
MIMQISSLPPRLERIFFLQVSRTAAARIDTERQSSAAPAAELTFMRAETSKAAAVCCNGWVAGLPAARKNASTGRERVVIR